MSNCWKACEASGTWKSVFQICIPYINTKNQIKFEYILEGWPHFQIHYSFTKKKTLLRNKNNQASIWHFWSKTNKMWHIYNICLQSLNAPSVQVNVSANPDNESVILLLWYCLLGIAQINHVRLHLHLTGPFFQCHPSDLWHCVALRNHYWAWQISSCHPLCLFDWVFGRLLFIPVASHSLRMNPDRTGG